MSVTVSLPDHNLSSQLPPSSRYPCHGHHFSWRAAAYNKKSPWRHGTQTHAVHISHSVHGMLQQGSPRFPDTGQISFLIQPPLSYAAGHTEQEHRRTGGLQVGIRFIQNLMPHAGRILTSPNALPKTPKQRKLFLPVRIFLGKQCQDFP